VTLVDALHALAAVCLVTGALLNLTAGIGLVRFPDVLSRMHSATKPQVLGLLLMLVGTGLRLDRGADVLTLVLVGAFQVITAPIAAQMVARAAYRTGQVREDLLVVDELVEQHGNPADE
jgi:multicomponent Na+:H+ antiporter subunit G